MFFRKIAFVVLIASLLPSLSRGNGAGLSYSDGAFGGTLKPEKNSNIAMIREYVDIDARYEDHIVKADFAFGNYSEKEQDITMGFPFDYYSYDTPAPATDMQQFLESKFQKQLIVNVDGQAQDSRFTQNRKYVIPKGRNVWNSEEDSPALTLYRIWAYWPVHFNSGYSQYDPDEVAVTVVYISNNTMEDHGKVPDPSLLYFLRSGRTWSRLVESSTIRIHYGIEYYDDEVVRMFPDGYVHDKQANTVTWQFRGEIPDTDIYFGHGSEPYVGGFEQADRERKLIWDQEMQEDGFAYPTSAPTKTAAQE